MLYYRVELPQFVILVYLSLWGKLRVEKCILDNNN